MGHLLAERLNAMLDEALLCIDVQSTVFLLSKLRNLPAATVEFVKAIEVIRIEIAAFFSDLTLEISAFFSVKLEKMTSSVAVNCCDFSVGV